MLCNALTLSSTLETLSLSSSTSVTASDAEEVRFRLKYRFHKEVNIQDKEKCWTYKLELKCKELSKIKKNVYIEFGLPFPDVSHFTPTPPLPHLMNRIE